MVSNPVGGLLRLGVVLASASLASLAFGLNTTAEANGMAYDAYNNNTAPQAVTVTGIVVSQPKWYDSTLATPLAQPGVSFGTMVIEDPGANRMVNGHLYSNAIQVYFGTNYGTIAAGTPFPLSLADRQNYHFPQQGDLVTVTGVATIFYGNISAIYPLTTGDVPEVDMSDTSTYPMMTIISENNSVTPVAVTPSTFAQPPYIKPDNTAVAGLVDTHSRKGQVGWPQNDLVINPMLGMLVTCSGFKYDQINPKNLQQSYNNGKVGLMIAGSGASSFADDACLFVNCRPSLGTGETVNPIDAGATSPGGTTPVTGIVCSHLLIYGTQSWNATGIQARTQDDIADSSGGGNRVSYTTVDQTLSNPVPGGQVDITLTALEANMGAGTVTADLNIMGPGGATDLSSNPITSLTLTPVAPGANTYKGSFLIGGPAVKGLLPPSIHYVNTGTNAYLNTSSVFSPVTNAVPFASMGALKAVMFSLPDGYPVAIDSSIPGTVLPIVTVAENDYAAFVTSTSHIWVQDPLVPAGNDVYMPDGSRLSPITSRGDAVSLAGFLTTYFGEREIQCRKAYVHVQSSGNPVPAPTFINTNSVSLEYSNPNVGQKTPPCVLPTEGLLVTVAGKVTFSPGSTAGGLLVTTNKGYVDIDDGTGPTTLKIATGNGGQLLANMLKVGDTVLATGICAANTPFAGPNTKYIVRTIWIRSPQEVLKAPTTSAVSVSAAVGGIVTLKAPVDPALQNNPSVLATLSPQRLYNGTYYSGPAGSNPWWKGLDFLQTGEGYKATVAGTVNYNGLVTGSGTDYTGTTQSFDLTALPRLYPMFDTPGSPQLAGISYSNHGVLWDADGPTNAFWSYSGKTFDNTVGAASSTLAALNTAAPTPITSPHTFAAGEGFSVTTKGTGDALYLSPTAATVTGSLTVQTVFDVVYVGSPNGLAVEVQLRAPSSTTAITTVDTTLDASGEVTLTGVVAGLYDVWVRPIGMLSTKVSTVAIPAGGSGYALADGPLHAGIVPGDTSDDNAINLLDLSTVLANFGSVVGPPEDANGDGHENLADLSIILSNYNQKGVP